MSNILTDGELLANILSFQPVSQTTAPSLSDTGKFRLRDMEKEHIKRVLLQCDGNKSMAARHLGISLNKLYDRLNSYDLHKAKQCLQGK